MTNMGSQEVVLYDIPSRAPCRAWSLNTWRVRLILNYKNIPYRTEWVEYPDIKPTLAPHFPNASIATYTVPTIALPNEHGSRYIMNSKDIAKALESTYPDPPLLVDTRFTGRMTELQGKIWDAVEPVILTHVHKRILNEVNFGFWRETREPWVNPGCGAAGTDDTGETQKSAAGWKTLEQVEAELYFDEGALMDKAWKEAGPVVDAIATLLREDGRGPFLCGADVSFDDFRWIGFLLFVRRIGEDQWDKMKAFAKDFGPHEALLYEAKEWTERDDN